jgi:hypothetical protein
MVMVGYTTVSWVNRVFGARVPFDDKQQQGLFVWQEGFLFNAIPTVAWILVK